MQAVLAERFNLEVRWSTRDVPGYALVRQT
jgi:uncharacterized protein (TIGR03435 family)